VANPDADSSRIEADLEPVKIVEFGIEGLFGTFNHRINFPASEMQSNDPSILIVSGENGSGKTTILKMINGMLGLNFDEFRRVPFQRSWLTLSSGDELQVDKTNRTDFPLFVRFKEFSAELGRTRGEDYNEKQARDINDFRENALPVVKNIDFELITIDRSVETETKSDHFELDAHGRMLPRRKPEPTLSKKVKDFLRDAQVNYRRFFAAEDLDLLPRILSRFTNEGVAPSSSDLVRRVIDIKQSNTEMQRFGIQTSSADLTTIENLLTEPAYSSEQHSLHLIETYIEVHENISRQRMLIVQRLKQFEKIMDDFLIAKSVRVHARDGLKIQANSGLLKEEDLSSGEYHFLFMMVSALLCQRAGSVLAIDEPELSLHVSWQRRLVSALAKCAAGAAPLFLFATHSTAISAEHRDRVITLSAVD
jgi:predicted ATPase